MEKSESIAALAAALSAAQAEMGGAKKDAMNPYFKAKYADLASVWDACRFALTKNGLSVIQLVGSGLGSGQGTAKVTTVLAHSSGEFISSELELTPKSADPQGMGSAITYARRYALAAIAGIAPEDDDGNAATHGAQEPPKAKAEDAAPPIAFDMLKQSILNADTAKKLFAVGNSIDGNKEKLSSDELETLRLAFDQRKAELKGV
jgi:hypothetical protein